MGPQLSPAQITKLRDQYANIDKIDPESPTYKALIAALDRYDINILRQLADARIKFVSGLAANRARNAAAKPVQEGNPKTKEWFDKVGDKQKERTMQPADMNSRRLGRGVVKMTTQKYQDKLMKEDSPTAVHSEIIQGLAGELASLPRVSTEQEYKASVRRLLQSKPVVPAAQVESMVQQFVKTHPFSKYRNRSMNRVQTEAVTDYTGKVGGNRKALLAQLGAATSKQQQSELATKARKAGATQSELNAALKPLNELSDRVLTSYEKRAQHQKQLATDVANRDDTDPRTWIKATNFAGKRDQGIRRASARRSLPEDANGAEYFTRWEQWKYEVEKVGGQTEHAGHGQYRAIGIDGEGFGIWDEHTGEGYIDFDSNGEGPYMGNNDSLGESNQSPSFPSFAAADQFFRDKAHERGNNPVQQFGEGDANKYRRFVQSHVKASTGSLGESGEERGPAFGKRDWEAEYENKPYDQFLKYKAQGGKLSRSQWEEDRELGEAAEDVATDDKDENPRNIEKEEPSEPKFDWVSKFDLGEIKEAMQKIVDHLADTEDAEQTDLLRNDIRVLDNLHDALRKADGKLVDKCWTIAKSEGSAEHLHDEFRRRMDDACATVQVDESYISEATFTNKAQWKKAAKQYRVKDSGSTSSAFCKDSGEMMGRWNDAKNKGWIDPKGA